MKCVILPIEKTFLVERNGPGTEIMHKHGTRTIFQEVGIFWEVQLMPVSLNLWWELSFLRIIWGDWAYHSLAPCWAAMLTVLLKEWTRPWLQASWALIWMLSWIKGIFYTAGCRNMFPSLFKIRFSSPSLLLSRIDSLRRLLSHCSAAVVLKTEGPLKCWHAHIWVAFSYYFVLQELWRWVLLQRVSPPPTPLRVCTGFTTLLIKVAEPVHSMKQIAADNTQSIRTVTRHNGSGLIGFLFAVILKRYQNHLFYWL